MENNLLSTPDFVRSVLISMAALLFGFVLFAAFQTYRDRDDIVPPRKVPPLVTGVFIAGYLSLLAHTAWCRWESLGSGQIHTGTILTMLALTINLIAVAMLLYYKRDAGTPSLSELRANDPGIVGTILRWKIFKNALDDQKYGKSHGKAVHPGRRDYDRMTPRQMIEEVENFVEKDDGPQ